MDRERQEKEVMEYLKGEFPDVYQNDGRYDGRWVDIMKQTVKAIMRRYDLVPRGE